MKSAKRNIVTYLFLCAYLSFTLGNALHFHKYSLLSEHCFDKYGSKNFALNHFLPDSSICTIIFFSSTILDIKFSSKDLIFFKIDKIDFKPTTEIVLPNSSLFKSNTLRSPPVVFS